MTGNIHESTAHARVAPAKNNLNVLRFVAASLVLVAHGVELPSGLEKHDWIYSATGKSLGWYAVSAFFVISGYLILMSWQRNPSLSSFVQARFLRIMPGLLIMLITVVSVLGLFFSALDFLSYIRDKETLSYFVGCLSIIFVKYDLPGVFHYNPIRVVNGSLWTLRYEIFCYACVAFAGLLGILRHCYLRRIALSLCISTALVVLIWAEFTGYAETNSKLGMLSELARLTLCFLLGALYFEFQNRLPLSFIGLLGLIGFALIAIQTPLFTPILVVMTAYATLWFAFVPNGKWIRWTRSAPDYSYGMYIYSCPIQQAIISLSPTLATGVTILLSFCVTIPFAALSWHLIEQPALALKRLKSPLKGSLLESPSGKGVG